MNSKLLQIGTSVILASVIGVAGVEALFGCQLSAIALNAKQSENFLLSEKTKGKQSKIILRELQLTSSSTIVIIFIYIAILNYIMSV